MKQREVELDLLRILALFGVLTIHCLGLSRGAAPSSDFSSGLLTAVGSLVTWQIPIYVMISGRFFLAPERELSSGKLLKAIKRIAAAFLIWDLIYQVFYYCTGTYTDLNWKGILTEAAFGPYHFWFLFMIAGLYLVSPLLCCITKSKRSMQYYIALFCIVSAINGYAVEIPTFGPVIAEIARKTNIHLVVGYTGYYVLGYYLRRYGLPDRWEKILYAAAAVLAVAATAATIVISKNTNIDHEMFVGYLKPNIIVVSSAIFVFFTKRVSKHRFAEETAARVGWISEHSFGVYLIHALVADALVLSGFTALYSPVLMLPVTVLLVFAVSLLITALLRRIPGIGKIVT